MMVWSLEDDVPLQLGDFLSSMLIFGCIEVGSLSHCLELFLNFRWCRMSSINSIFKRVQFGWRFCNKP